MNKTLKLQIVRQMQDASKTYEAIANNQRKAGFTKDASVTMVRKSQLDSTIAAVQATIEESPKPQSKKKKSSNKKTVEK